MPYKLTTKTFLVFVAVIIPLRIVTLFKPVPTYGSYYFHQGADYAEKGDAAKAIENYKMALYHNPDQPQANVRMGAYYSQKGDHAAALIHYRRIVNAHLKARKYSPAYNALGKFYFDQKNLPAAIDMFNQSISLGSVDTNRYYLGLISLINNDVDSAKAHLKQLRDDKRGQKIQPYYDRLEKLIEEKSNDPGFVIEDFAENAIR